MNNSIKKFHLIFTLSMFLVFVSMIIDVPVAFGGINQWTSNGPTGGWVSAVTISPQYNVDQTVLLGSSGGIYKSVIGGTTWNRSGLEGLGILSIAFSPDYLADNEVIAGTWLEGAHKSVDGGVSWFYIALGASFHVCWHTFNEETGICTDGSLKDFLRYFTFNNKPNLEVTT